MANYNTNWETASISISDPKPTHDDSNDWRLTYDDSTIYEIANGDKSWRTTNINDEWQGAANFSSCWKPDNVGQTTPNVYLYQKNVNDCIACWRIIEVFQGPRTANQIDEKQRYDLISVFILKMTILRFFFLSACCILLSLLVRFFKWIVSDFLFYCCIVR